jgi:heme-degrading monooxygenase HmoA
VTVVSVLRMPLRAGREEDLAQAFRDLDVFGHSRASGGFRGGRVLRPLEPDAHVLVVAEWDGPDDYERWLQNPVRARLSEALEPLVAGELEGAEGVVYEEAHRG